MVQSVMWLLIHADLIHSYIHIHPHISMFYSMFVHINTNSGWGSRQLHCCFSSGCKINRPSLWMMRKHGATLEFSSLHQIVVFHFVCVLLCFLCSKRLREEAVKLRGGNQQSCRIIKIVIVDLDH